MRVGSDFLRRSREDLEVSVQSSWLPRNRHPSAAREGFSPELRCSHWAFRAANVQRWLRPVIGNVLEVPGQRRYRTPGVRPSRERIGLRKMYTPHTATHH